MIRARLVGNHGQPLILFGLDRENLARLQADEPIHVQLRHLSGTDETIDDLPDVDIIIAFDDGELAAKMLNLPRPNLS